MLQYLKNIFLILFYKNQISISLKYLENIFYLLGIINFTPDPILNSTNLHVLSMCIYHIFFTWKNSCGIHMDISHLFHVEKFMWNPHGYLVDFGGSTSSPKISQKSMWIPRAVLAGYILI